MALFPPRPLAAVSIQAALQKVKLSLLLCNNYEIFLSIFRLQYCHVFETMMSWL